MPQAVSVAELVDGFLEGACEQQRRVRWLPPVLGAKPRQGHDGHPTVHLGLSEDEVQAGRVLLASHTYRRQPWDLPGGFVRRGEQPAASLQRELREELGVPAMVGPLLAAATAGSHLTLYYRATLNGLPRPDGVEIDGYRFVAAADIPALLGTTPRWLAWVAEPDAAARSAA